MQKTWSCDSSLTRGAKNISSIYLLNQKSWEHQIWLVGWCSPKFFRKTAYFKMLVILPNICCFQQFLHLRHEKYLCFDFAHFLNNTIITTRHKRRACYFQVSKSNFQIKSFKSIFLLYSLCYAEACSLMSLWSPSPRHCARATQLLSKKSRSGGESLEHSVQFNRIKIWISDLSHQRRTRYSSTNWPVSKMSIIRLHDAKSVPQTVNNKKYSVNT